MHEVTQVDWALEQSTLLDSLHPSAHRNTLLVERTNPSTGVNGAVVPEFLPGAGQNTLQKFFSNRLSCGSQHG